MNGLLPLLITIDTSVIIAVITNEPSKKHLISLTTGHELVAPTSVHWEVGNALSGMLKRQRITLTEATKCIDIYQSVPIRMIDVRLNNALIRADKHRMYAYDAYLLTCVEQTRSTLLTLDRALYNIAKSAGIKTMDV